jgi:hypothetical protein
VRDDSSTAPSRRLRCSPSPTFCTPSPKLHAAARRIPRGAHTQCRSGPLEDRSRRPRHGGTAEARRGARRVWRGLHRPIEWRSTRAEEPLSRIKRDERMPFESRARSARRCGGTPYKTPCSRPPSCVPAACSPCRYPRTPSLMSRHASEEYGK